MEEYEKEMITEYNEIFARLMKLAKFIYKAPEFDKLDRKERRLLVEQYTAMKAYERTLSTRIFEHGLGEFILNGKDGKDS